MLLKMLLALVPMLFFSDAAGGSDAGDGGDEGDDAGEGGDKNSGTSNSSGDDQSGKDKGDADSANKQLKDFAKDRGITVAEILTNYQKLEDAGKTELQRKDDELNRYKTAAETAQQELQRERAEKVVSAAAAKANAIQPEAVFALVANQVTYGKDGKPDNVDKVIAAAKTAYPKLFGEGLGGSDAGEQGDSAPFSFNDMIRSAAGHG